MQIADLERSNLFESHWSNQWLTHDRVNESRFAQLVVASPRPAEQESVTFSRRIKVRTDDVALTVDSPRNGRRRARIVEGNEAERTGQASLGIGPKPGDQICQVQHETVIDL